MQDLGGPRVPRRPAVHRGPDRVQHGVRLCALGQEADRTGGGAAHRRNLLVKPGITGLWQLWGREPSAVEADGVDLRYVEDWSPALDARILLRTLRTAMVSRTR